MEFFGQAINTLSILVIAIGAGLGVWGVVNLLEGYGSDNPGANAHVPRCRAGCERASEDEDRGHRWKHPGGEGHRNGKESSLQRPYRRRQDLRLRCA